MSKKRASPFWSRCWSRQSQIPTLDKFVDPSDSLLALQKGTRASHITPVFPIQFSIFQTQKKRIKKETGRTHRHQDQAKAFSSFNDLNPPGTQSLVPSAPLGAGCAGGREVHMECWSCQKTSPRQETGKRKLCHVTNTPQMDTNSGRGFILVC